MNTRINSIIEYVGVSQEQAALVELYAREVVGETILAILATNCKDIIYTTYDQDRVHGIIGRVVDQVRNHWEFK